ncbi:MAG: 3-oxoacyl-ACP reductase FabG [Rickettsiales bacterium]|nr:3-oxoacyl-ACP reductase FabG [Rickettsiales bacterium]
MLFDLTGKKALVTGASGGIGSAIAQALSQQGATVALSGTREAKLKEVQEKIGNNSRYFTCNLLEDDVEAFFNNVDKEMDGIDILVANAGITRDNLALRMKHQDWQDVLDVNLTSTFFLNRAAFKKMMKRRYGRIINITSVVGVNGNPGQTNYAASKAGMIGMSKSLASETATRGVTVNCVAPGFIQTDMTDVLNDEQKESIASSIPMGILGKPDDIAATVAYLASTEAGYVTGQTLHVNGGMLRV